MPLRDLGLFTDYELRQELGVTRDPAAAARIRGLLRDRAAQRVGEHAAEALEFPSRFAVLGDEVLLALWPLAADEPSRDALVRQLWARGIPAPEAAEQ
jgi:hypothetical protein